MKDCPKCNYPNADENKFCRECGTKLGSLKNYCPNCDRIFTYGEKFCTECGTKLVAKPKYTNESKPSKQYALKEEPKQVEESFAVKLGMYHPKRKPPVVKNNPSKRNNSTSNFHPPEDTFGYIGRDSPTAEFKGKTREELELELRFVTNKYEDCKKTGDYMTTYYKDKKDILERLLEDD